MNIEQQIIAVMRELSPARRGEVLDFAAFLRQRVEPAQGSRPYGLCAGEIKVADDFDSPLPDDELELFE